MSAEREIASVPALCRPEQWAERRCAWGPCQAPIEQFIASFDAAPNELVPDFDATDDPLHGQQAGASFTATDSD